MGSGRRGPHPFPGDPRGFRLQDLGTRQEMDAAGRGFRVGARFPIQDVTAIRAERGMRMPGMHPLVRAGEEIAATALHVNEHDVANVGGLLPALAGHIVRAGGVHDRPLTIARHVAVPVTVGRADKAWRALVEEDLVEPGAAHGAVTKGGHEKGRGVPARPFMPHLEEPSRASGVLVEEAAAYGGVPRVPGPKSV